MRSAVVHLQKGRQGWGQIFKNFPRVEERCSLRFTLRSFIWPGRTIVKQKKKRRCLWLVVTCSTNFRRSLAVFFLVDSSSSACCRWQKLETAAASTAVGVGWPHSWQHWIVIVSLSSFAKPLYKLTKCFRVASLSFSSDSVLTSAFLLFNQLLRDVWLLVRDPLLSLFPFYFHCFLLACLLAQLISQVGGTVGRRAMDGVSLHRMKKLVVSKCEAPLSRRPTALGAVTSSEEHGSWEFGYPFVQFEFAWFFRSVSLSVALFPFLTQQRVHDQLNSSLNSCELSRTTSRLTSIA